MNEKAEAFCEANYEILRVTNSGEFIWNENADQMIRDPVFTEANPAIIYVVRALRQAEVIRQENERLRGLLTDASKAVWMNYDGDLLDRIEAALKEVSR